MSRTKPAKEKHWHVIRRNCQAEQRILPEIDLHKVALALLCQREKSTPEEINRFIRPDIRDLADPFLMEDMSKAVDRIRKAVFDQERILIYGDYDVDGITGTSLLKQFFQMVHADITAFIPHRIDDGYSLQKHNIDRFAAEGIKLIITVDCGSTNVEEIDYANKLGLDVILTDHHEFKSQVPNAYAILSPIFPGTTYPFGRLCGCGVAFKLAWAIGESFSPEKKMSPEIREFLRTALSLVAVGTIADVVPLLSENRILVRHGLESLRRTTNPGLRALLQGADLGKAENLVPSDIAFRIAPKINAAGRIGSPMTAMDLLTTTDTVESLHLEERLTAYNNERKDIERAILEDALDKISNLDMEENPVIVLDDEKWHPGVIGIVASRLSEEYSRPAVLIAMGEDKGRGSGRSISTFNLYDAVSAGSEHLLGFGGHSHAAGLEIAKGKVSAFRRAITEFSIDKISAAEMIPKLDIDLEIELSDISYKLMRDLDMLQPFGEGNPAPLFVTRGVKAVGNPRLVGVNNNHLIFYAAKNGSSFKCVAFNRGDAHDWIQQAPLDIVYEPKLNTWQGETNIELMIRDFSSP
ncbi:single-stranded-DNA-specific exonuclease RecJ [Planctomycetota bacterium]